MKYFKNDIVEIITANYKSWNDIPSHERGYYEQQNEPAPTIGQRFRVEHISERKIYAEIRGQMCLGIQPDCVLLFNRPFINWFYSFYDTYIKTLWQRLKKQTRKRLLKSQQLQLRT